MSSKSAILILAVIIIIGAVFMVFMFKSMPPVAEAPDITNKETGQTDEAAALQPEEKPLTTQEKKERINQIFEELNSNNTKESPIEQTEEKTERTNEIFKELNSPETIPEDKTEVETDQEKRQRLEDIFEELNK